jgi:hypothetical protein
LLIDVGVGLYDLVKAELLFCFFAFVQTEEFRSGRRPAARGSLVFYGWQNPNFTGGGSRPKFLKVK